MHSLGNVKEELKEQLVNGWRTADISDQDKLILGYAEKITKEAYTIDRPYIDALRAGGLSNNAIHDISQISSYFNYVNRVADSLGIELEK